MLSTTLAASAALFAQLPYAPSDPDLIFQSTDAVTNARNAFEDFADTSLSQFVQLSQKKDYNTAYQIWSDLHFRYMSLKLELDQTLDLSLNDEVKASIASQATRLEEIFQQKINSHPDLLSTFLRNAEASASLTSQQRFFTMNILKEYQDMHLPEATAITANLQKLLLQKTESFYQSKGIAAPLDPSTISDITILSANIICFPGKLPYLYGGISPWKERIDKLCSIISASNAQIVCLQEVWDPEAMRALAERLKEKYAFFVYDAGDPAGTLQVKKMGYNSGLFLASKLPLHSITFHRFPNSIPARSNRGALFLTASVAGQQFALINTHLQHGNTPEMQKARKEQLNQCYIILQDAISQLPMSSWGCLTGDLNIDAFSPEEFTQSSLPQLFSIPYTEQLSKEKATCTNYFTDLVRTPLDKRREVPVSYELLDYCIRTTSTSDEPPKQKLIRFYDISNNTDIPLSDHQALVTTWTLVHPTTTDTKQTNHQPH